MALTDSRALCVCVCVCMCVCVCVRACACGRVRACLFVVRAFIRWGRTANEYTSDFSSNLSPRIHSGALQTAEKCVECCE